MEKFFRSNKYGLFLSFCLIFLGLSAKAQIAATHKAPYSSSDYFRKNLRDLNSLKTTKVLFNQQSKVLENIERGAGTNYFAQAIPVNLSLKNSGQWMDLPDGRRLWRLKVESEGALSLYALYEVFNLAPGAEFYVLNGDESRFIGPYTSLDNPNTTKFASSLLRGSTMIFEYYEPKNLRQESEIQISAINYGFKRLEKEPEVKLAKEIGFGDAEDCHLNVNCPLGDDWQDEKKSIARVIMPFVGGQSFLCSGSLVNTLTQDETPYFLMAYHCQDAGTPLYEQFIFSFNYETGACSNPETEPASDNLVGCSLRALASNSDVLLIELMDGVPAGFGAYFNGWDAREDINPNNVVGIHHPAGDVKKISQSGEVETFDNLVIENQETSTNWACVWNQGTTEGGSSGSPLFDENHRVIGQLFGGTTDNCSGSKTAFYPKLSSAWNLLSPFLDPNNSGTRVINGFDPNSTALDLGITNIESQLDDCSLSESSLFSLSVRNFGTSNVSSSFNVNYQLLNASNELLETQSILIEDDIAAGGTLNLDINVDVGLRGNYTLIAETQIGGDLNQENNTFTRLIENKKVTKASEGILLSAVDEQINANWTSGDGEGRIILIKEGSDFTAADLPQNGVSYATSVNIGDVPKIGEAFPIPPASLNSTFITGLDLDKTYYLAVVEFSCNPPVYFTEDLNTASIRTTNLEEEILAASVKVFPNPSSDYVQVKISNDRYQEVNLELYDVLGQKLGEERMDPSLNISQSFEVQHLKPGLYILKVKTDKASISLKVLVE